MSIAFRVRSRPGDPRGSASVLDPWRNVDWMMIWAAGALAVIGVFNIYATTSPRLVLRGADPFYFTQRQVLFVFAAVVALGAVMFFGHDWLRSKAVWLYAATTFSLFILLLWGRASGETKLSFDLGAIAVQPAEVMKPVLVLVLAAWFADAGMRTMPYDEFIRALLIAGAPFLLIALQPDLGSAMTIAAGVFGVLLIAGTQRRHFVFITILAATSFVASIWSGVVRDYQLERFTALWNQNNTSDQSRVTKRLQHYCRQSANHAQHQSRNTKRCRQDCVVHKTTDKPCYGPGVHAVGGPRTRDKDSQNLNGVSKRSHLAEQRGLQRQHQQRDEHQSKPATGCRGNDAIKHWSPT